MLEETAEEVLECLFPLIRLQKKPKAVKLLGERLEANVSINSTSKEA